MIARFLARLVEPLVRLWQRACEHNPSWVAADILEGGALLALLEGPAGRHYGEDSNGVRWCNRCGAFRFQGSARWREPDATAPRWLHSRAESWPVAPWRRWRAHLPWFAPVLLLLLPATLGAQEPSPRPSPSPTAPSIEQPMRVHVDGILMLSMGAGVARPTPGLSVSVDGPLVFGNAPHEPKIHGSLGLDILGVPGDPAAPTLSAPTTWNTVRARAGALFNVGRLTAGAQDLRSSVGFSAFFGTKITADPAPLDRTIRGWSLDVQFEERHSGLLFRAGYGHDDSVSTEFGHGALLLSTQIPIAHTAGIASIGGEAALAIGRPEGVVTHDRVILRLILELPTKSSGPANNVGLFHRYFHLRANPYDAPTQLRAVGETSRSGPSGQVVGARDEGSRSASGDPTTIALSEETQGAASVAERHPSTRLVQYE